MLDIDPVRAVLFLAFVCAVAVAEIAVRAKAAGVPFIEFLLG